MRAGRRAIPTEERQSAMLEQFTYSTFAPYLGSGFRVYLDLSRSVELRLAEATELISPSRSTARGAETGSDGRSFSLTFLGPRDPLIPQGSYRFCHDQIGTFPLFIVPIGAGAAGVSYQAVFSRLAE